MDIYFGLYASTSNIEISAQVFSFHLPQDNYFEEALKMRNLLEEFHCDHGLRPPTILGVREHVFTGRCFESYTCMHLFVAPVLEELS